MPQFRKKPVVIEAVYLNKDPTAYDVKSFYDFMERCSDWSGDHRAGVSIRTLEGVMRADPGDWIIRGVKGEYYPCKDDIFEATYDSI